METLVASVPKERHMLAVEDKSTKSVDATKRPAPMASGCRIEGFVRVKKVFKLFSIFLFLFVEKIVGWSNAPATFLFHFK